MPDSEAPATPRLSWAAALFALLAGVTMLYVPYEFGAPIFRPLYPHIRPLGALLLLSGALLVASVLYPRSSPSLQWSGRVLLGIALAPYWYVVSLQQGNVTGVGAYPALVALVLLEHHPRFRGRGTLGLYAALIGLFFGYLFLVTPAIVHGSPIAALGHSIRWVGTAFIVASLWTLWSWRKGEASLNKAAYLVFSVLFASVAWPVVSGRSWIGGELYASLSVVCLLAAAPKLPRPVGIRWHLLRGLILAAVFPILTLGALTSKLAQDAIRAELWTEARQVVSAEVTWLEEFHHQFRFLLEVEAADPALLSLMKRSDQAALNDWLERIDKRSSVIDRLLLVDPEGEPLGSAPSAGKAPAPTYAHRDYVQQVVRTGEPFLSPPFQSTRGPAMVVASLPVLDERSRLRGVLAGGFLLERASSARRASLSSSYVIQVFDRRTGSLLRDSEHNAWLTPVRLTPETHAEVMAHPSGIVERFDEKGAMLLIAHEGVPGTPWVVVATARAQQAYAPLSRLSLLVIIVAFATACVAVLLSHFVSLDLARRLGALRTSFAHWTGLSDDVRPKPRMTDEITALENALREMAGEIERAQSELRSAIAVRDQFLSVASHELRTPLTPLQMTLDLIVRQLDRGEELRSEKQRVAVDRMRRQVQRLTRLIGTLLDVSRIQAGRFALDREKMELGTVLRTVVERIQQDHPLRGAQLKLQLPAGPVEGEWDPDRLDQVLTNLIENAFRYSPKDTPVQVTLREERGTVEIVVVDEGMGIPEDALPKVFAPFFRAENAAASHSGGLGLGLSICREIVERHGGRIWATSEGPGKGTEFHVVLPRPSPLASAG